jgi:hypothetical protein
MKVSYEEHLCCPWSELDPFLHDELTTDIDHATLMMMIITFHAAIYLQVPQESSTASDPAILEWMKQAWDSWTAGSRGPCKSKVQNITCKIQGRHPSILLREYEGESVENQAIE